MSRTCGKLVREETQAYDHRYLAELVFGPGIVDDHLSALTRALFEDHVYFKLKEGRFTPNPVEKVEQILRQREEEARREETLSQGSEWLKSVKRGRASDPPPRKDEIVQLLIQMVLHGTEAPQLKAGKELLSRAGISDVKESRRILVDLRVWDEDENLDLHRLGIEAAFTPEQQGESIRIAQETPDLRGREDLRDRETLTIDGPLTRDYDDALSLTLDRDILELGIHIADVASRLPMGSLIDREAAFRGASQYLPREQIPMIPQELSQDIFSLRKDCDRPALSLIAHLDRMGSLLDYRLVPSIIRVRHQLTYGEINRHLMEVESLGQGTHRGVEERQDVLKAMAQLSQRLRHQRMEKGALDLSLAEVEVKFGTDSSFWIEKVDQDSPSRVIVSELMILYNNLLARFCSEKQIPILYRTQARPNEILSRDGAGHIYYVFQQRRKLSPVFLEGKVQPHCGLGLEAYIHCTSPIRRYLDIVAQRQVLGFLSGSRAGIR